MSNDFRNGIAFSITITAFAFAFVVIAMVVGNNNIPIDESSSSGEVVGKYKECDIIRWTQHNLAEYKYFLYCENNK